METSSSHPAPVICSIGEGSNGNLNFNNAVERIKELLGNFQDTKSIIHINIENLALDSLEKDGIRSRSRSRDGIRSRSRSRSGSESHSEHLRGRFPPMHHGRGLRPPPPFLRRRRPHPYHHHGGPNFPPHHYSPEIGQNNNALTSGVETSEQYSGGEPYYRGEGGPHRRWHGTHARFAERNIVQTKESEEPSVPMMYGEEPRNPFNTERNLQKKFDNLNVSNLS